MLSASARPVSVVLLQSGESEAGHDDKANVPPLFLLPFPRPFFVPSLRPQGQSASVFAHSPQHPIPDGSARSSARSADTDGEQGQGGEAESLNVISSVDLLLR